MKHVRYFALMLLVCVSLVGCGSSADDTKTSEEIFVEKSDEESTDAEDSTSQTDELEKVDRVYNDDGQVKSLLTGEWVDSKIGLRRPVAVMISNIEAAQPMSGVGSADIFYEAPVEGGITRCMGIFENYDDLDKIGSVRSCRDYFLYYALEYDAIYAHYGQSAYAVEVLNRDYVDNLSGLSGIGSTVFYRTTDRQSPHNAYCSAEGISAGIAKMKYRTDYVEGYGGKFKFADDGETVSFPEIGTYTHLEPGYDYNEPYFEYNKDDQLYYRFQFGNKHIDDTTGEQLTFSNVIFQYSDWEVRDEKGYLAFDCHGKGYGLYFTNGTGTEVHWERVGDQETGMIKYYNMQTGKEIELNQGKTCICIIEDFIGGEVNDQVVFR